MSTQSNTLLLGKAIPIFIPVKDLVNARVFKHVFADASNIYHSLHPLQVGVGRLLHVQRACAVASDHARRLGSFVRRQVPAPPGPIHIVILCWLTEMAKAKFCRHMLAASCQLVTAGEENHAARKASVVLG